MALGHYYLKGIPNSTITADTSRALEMFAYAAFYFGEADAQWFAKQPAASGALVPVLATKGECRGEAVCG